MSSFLFLSISWVIGAQVLFEYTHQEGEQWHLTSRVNEEILFDGELYHEAEILNKISVEILRGYGGDGQLYNRYQIAERPVDSDVYAWSAEYEARYNRDIRGRLSGLKVSPPIPSVRNVPVYPDDEVSISDTWSEPGSELFDLKPTYGIDEIVEIDFEASYRYVGNVELEGRSTEKVLIEYSYDWTPNPSLMSRLQRHAIYPLGIVGEFRQELYWDSVAGRNFAEEGLFAYTYFMNDGHSYTFRGRSEGRAVYAEPMDRDALVEEISGLEDVNAEAVEDGVAITLENIHFIPDSPVMLSGQDNKLERIAEFLRKYPSRDILVIGHTAEVYSYSDGVELSENRAKTVARYFINRGVRSATQIMTRGMGHSRPIADNSTEEGRKKNRRVEIIILEN